MMDREEWNMGMDCVLSAFGTRILDFLRICHPLSFNEVSIKKHSRQQKILLCVIFTAWKEIESLIENYESLRNRKERKVITRHDWNKLLNWPKMVQEFQIFLHCAMPNCCDCKNVHNYRTNNTSNSLLEIIPGKRHAWSEEWKFRRSDFKILLITSFSIVAF